MEGGTLEAYERCAQALADQKKSKFHQPEGWLPGTAGLKVRGGFPGEKNHKS